MGVRVYFNEDRAIYKFFKEQLTSIADAEAAKCGGIPYSADGLIIKKIFKQRFNCNILACEAHGWIGLSFKRKKDYTFFVLSAS